MKKRNLLKQYPDCRKIKPEPDPFPTQVHFWLVKMDAELFARVDALRKKNGHNKKETVRRMANAWLMANDHPDFLE